MSPVIFLYTATVCLASFWCSVIVHFKGHNWKMKAFIKSFRCYGYQISEKVFFYSVGPSVLSIVNGSLSTDCVPSCSTQISRNLNLTLCILNILDPFLNYHILWIYNCINNVYLLFFFFINHVVNFSSSFVHNQRWVCAKDVHTVNRKLLQ